MFAWLEGPLLAQRPPVAQAMRMKERIADGRYVVRAELPGLDPAEDIEVFVFRAAHRPCRDGFQLSRGRGCNWDRAQA